MIDGGVLLAFIFIVSVGIALLFNG